MITSHDTCNLSLKIAILKKNCYIKNKTKKKQNNNNINNKKTKQEKSLPENVGSPLSFNKILFFLKQQHYTQNSCTTSYHA